MALIVARSDKRQPHQSISDGMLWVALFFQYFRFAVVHYLYSSEIFRALSSKQTIVDSDIARTKMK